MWYLARVLCFFKVFQILYSIFTSNDLPGPPKIWNSKVVIQPSSFPAAEEIPTDLALGFSKGRRTVLVGGWTTHLKNMSRNGNLPQFSGVKIKISETTTQCQHSLCAIVVHIHGSSSLFIKRCFVLNGERHPCIVHQNVDTTCRLLQKHVCSEKGGNYSETIQFRGCCV